MTPSGSIAEFIRARLAEFDPSDLHDIEVCRLARFRDEPCDCGVPGRVLRGVEAKRRIVKLAEVEREARNTDPGESMFMDFVLKRVASEWSDHPDYQAEWP